MAIELDRVRLRALRPRSGEASGGGSRTLPLLALITYDRAFTQVSAFFVFRTQCEPATVRDSQVAVAASNKEQGVLLFCFPALLPCGIEHSFRIEADRKVGFFYVQKSNYPLNEPNSTNTIKSIAKWVRLPKEAEAC